MIIVPDFVFSVEISAFLKNILKQLQASQVVRNKTFSQS